MGEELGMRVLVTGGAGFLGRSIVEQLLARGDDVRTFSRNRYPALELAGVEACQGDIRDPIAVAAACQGVDAVIHTAAVAGIGRDWDYFYGINTLGTQNVVAACRKHAVPRLVFCSSPSVTFDGSGQENVDESVPYPGRWLCHYQHTKALAEQHVLAANGAAGLLTCALRPHLIWGPRDQHLIPRLLDRARRGRLIRVGDGRNMIDTVYVENAAEAHLQALDALRPGSTVCGKAYFISQGEPVNCWNWINEILRLANLPPVRRGISFGVAWNVGAALELTYALLRRKSEPRMTRFLAAQLAKHHYFDIGQARRDFGYAPRISTADGMTRLYQWMSQSVDPRA
jgi:nucleoside-diphosphate-sugar epimerase